MDNCYAINHKLHIYCYY